MTDYLLKGLKEIHQEIFRGKDGRPLISFNTFRARYVEEMLEVGIIMELSLGRIKRRTYCGFASKLKRFLMIKQREKNREKKAKDLFK